MPFQSRPCARALLMAALVIGAATSGLAQSPSSPASPVQTPPAAPAPQPGAQTLATTGPQRSLSIDEAVQLALQQNLGIQIERLNPQLQDYTIGPRELHADPWRRRQLAESGFAAQQLPLGQLDDDHRRELRLPDTVRAALPLGHERDGVVR
jgi:hypothetical protein